MTDWKAIPGFGGKYEVNKAGQVQSLQRRVSRILRATPNGDGYPQVRLFNGTGASVSIKVASVVAEAFLGPRPPGMQVCHGNAVRTDSRVDNLRYGTAQENSDDRRLHGNLPLGEGNGMSTVPDETVRAIRAEYIGRGGPRQVDLAVKYGLSQSHVSAITRKAVRYRHEDIEIYERSNLS